MVATRGSISQAADPLGQTSDPADVFKNPVQAEFIRNLMRTISDAFMSAISRDRAAPYFFLSSPNGLAWKVSVSDTGVLSVEPARK